MASGNGARRADLANRLERAISSALTQELFGAGGPDEGGLLAAAMSVVKSRGADRDAVDRLERAGWSSPLLGRAAATVMADLPGVTSSPTASGDVPAEIAARVAERQRSTQTMLDALTVDLPTGERPWLPGPPVPPTVAGAAQATEFAELPTGTVSVTGGGYVTPAAVGFTTNVAWQASSVQDAVLEIVAERALYNVGQWVVAQLVAAAGAAVASVAAAITAVEAAGWQPDTILTPLSRLDRVSTALGAMGPAAMDGARLLVAPVGARILVASRAGLDFRVSERATAMVAEPAIGGYEVSTVYWSVGAVGAGAVKQVTA